LVAGVFEAEAEAFEVFGAELGEGFFVGGQLRDNQGFGQVGEVFADEVAGLVGVGADEFQLAFFVAAFEAVKDDGAGLDEEIGGGGDVGAELVFGFGGAGDGAFDVGQGDALDGGDLVVEGLDDLFEGVAVVGVFFGGGFDGGEGYFFAGIHFNMRV